MTLKDRARLEEFLEHQKLTGRALARKAGLGPGIIGHIVSGRRDTVSKATAEKIEAALEAPAGFLFEPTPKKIKTPK